MSLREKIEGLARWEPSDRYGVCMERKQDGRYIELFDVLRIVAEHEQECARFKAERDLLCEGLKLQRAVTFPHERQEDQSPGEARWAADEWMRKHGHLISQPVGHAGGECEECQGRGYLTTEVIPGVSNGRPICWRCYGTKKDAPTHEERRAALGVAEVEQMARQEAAEVPRWRRELERLHATIGQEPDPLSMADHRRLAALLDLAILADVIASGRGQAVVPRDLVRRLFALWAYDYTATRDGDYVRLRCAERHTTSVSVEIFMRELERYGDSLCGAP